MMKKKEAMAYKTVEKIKEGIKGIIEEFPETDETLLQEQKG